MADPSVVECIQSAGLSKVLSVVPLPADDSLVGKVPAARDVAPARPCRPMTRCVGMFAAILHSIFGSQGETITMSTMKPAKPGTPSAWVRIPDGTKVKHRHEGHVGFIDGLTEIVSGPNRNPDGKTQYRMNIGAPDRQLVTESDLSILIDDEELVIMLRQKAPYRRAVTQSLHSVLTPDRFVKTT